MMFPPHLRPLIRFMIRVKPDCVSTAMGTVIDITTAATTEPGEKFSLMAKHAETV